MSDRNTKKILITGSTDGIGLETARALFSMGHHVVLHGRNREKLVDACRSLAAQSSSGTMESHIADFSRLNEVELLAEAIIRRHDRLDVLINNAGVFRTADTATADGLDIRFAVNSYAPYMLTKRLLPLLGPLSRVINLSSAAQAEVDLSALAGASFVADQMDAYAQSKLALTMWSGALARSLVGQGPVMIAVNPGSFLATKMVREGFGMAGKDAGTGRDILVRAALSADFADASGSYFDNDSGKFISPHSDALDTSASNKVVDVMEKVLTGLRAN